MKENLENENPVEEGMTRREFFDQMKNFGAVVLLSTKLDKLIPEYKNIEDLPHAPEDMYSLRFRNNPTNFDRSDDLISEASKLAGNTSPNHWHVETIYHLNGRWMAIGCRPPRCGVDTPLEDLKKQFKGYEVDIYHLKVPVNNQLAARKWFLENMDKKLYSLGGPSKTNCSDAQYRLGLEANIKGINGIQKITRDKLYKIADDNPNFLKKYGLSSVDQIINREDIIFPDEFKKIGSYVGVTKF